MPRKVKLGHREIEVGLFLEILAVYAVLAVVLTAIYYIEPVITGFATVERQINHTDIVNLRFNESGTYEWILENPGNLKSLKITGRKISGTAKVYLEDDGKRYLIYDSNRTESVSGFPGITGFAVTDKKPGNEIKISITGILGDVDQALINLLVEDINSTKNNVEIEIKTEDEKVKEKIKGYISDSQQGIVDEIILSLENSIDDENFILISIESEFEDDIKAGDKNSDVDEGEGDENQEEVIPINETIINETVGNETAINNSEDNPSINESGRDIEINFSYGEGVAYDSNNDGIESLRGIIDYEISSSKFNWDVDESRLCTRYEIYSVEDDLSEFTCFGNVECCSFVGLENSRDAWNETLFLGYGSYGSGLESIIFAQVLYVDINLDINDPSSEIYYSSWGNLSGEFNEDIIEFEDACVETCLIDSNKSSYILVIELENSELNIDEIKYTINERVTNEAPILLKDIENISFASGEFSFDLRDYFSDDEELTYSYSIVDNISIRFENDIAYISFEEGFLGSRLVAITADDSKLQTVSNQFNVDIIELLENSLEIRDNDDNKIAVFDSLGNLLINGTLIENSELSYDDDDFVIFDSYNILSLVLANPEGDLKLRGILFENQSVLLPTLNSFVIENSASEIIAYVNDTGSMFLKGILTGGGLNE